MGKAQIIQTNFTAGELSPRIAMGRADVAKYANGSKRQENIALTVQGGARRRPGLRFIGEVKASGVARLIDFIYSRDQAYVLVMGEGYMRFVRNRAQILSGGVPYEIATPYTAAMRRGVRYAQKSDTAFFAHESVFPQRLQRFSDAQWFMGPMPFETPPLSEQGFRPAGTLTLGSPAVGTTTATSSIAVFSLTDRGREIEVAAGRGLITQYTSPTVVTVVISAVFPGTVAAAGDWRITGSPQAFIRPDAKESVGATANLYPSRPVNSILTLGSKVGGTVTTATALLPVFTAGDVGSVIYADIGSAKITGFTSSTVLNVTIQEDLLQTTYPANGWGITSSTWLPTDVGKYVQMNGGLYKITSQTGNAATSEIIQVASAIVNTPPNAWVLLSDTWDAHNGYPRAVALNGQRLLYASTFAYPQYLWASYVGNTLNFAPGVEDDQALAFELDGARNSPIQHLAPSRRLIAFTDLDEMTVTGGVDQKPLTPTNIQKTDESSAGSSAVRPLKAGNELLFVQAAGRKVHSIGYRYEIDGFNSPDRTIFAEHITAGGIVEMAYQKTPDPRLFCVRADGVMPVCIYDTDQEVIGWGRWITQGSFESVANIPTATAEDAYVIVARTVGGVTKRYLEVFDDTISLDSCATGEDGAGKAQWDNLQHLEGKVVQVLADGSYMGEFTVVGGSITLPRDAFAVQIGLGYTALIETLQVELANGGATTQGTQVSCTEVVLRTLDTKAIVLNGVEIDPRKFGPGILDQPPPDFQGDIRVASFTDEVYRVKQVISQPYPLPFHLLNVIRMVTVN